jgi:putative NADH-flavin reductase
MKILVVGATGPTGQEIISRGSALGHEMTALVRSHQHSAFPEGVRLFLGDVTNQASLGEAVRGHQAVISSLGTRKLGRTTLFSEGTRNLVASMKTAGVSRFICITGIGAGKSRGHGGFFYDRILQPLLLKAIYTDKDRQEDIVRSSGLDWTIVRPGQLTNGLRTGAYREIYDVAGVTIGRISRADVADSILKNLQDPQTHHKTVHLTY